VTATNPSLDAPSSGAPEAAPSEPRDRLGRSLRDLRISVTDRCNFRCRYCMPREEFSGKSFLPKNDLLSFEEIATLSGAFVRLGVTKLRLTGGEPLLRNELERLVAMLSELDVDLALTTNGVLLPAHARALAAAGLRRVTVSLDALDEDVFQKMSDAPRYGVRDVLAGIDAALAAGLAPVKINCVVRRGVNENQIEKLASHFRGSGSQVRFIEYMDVGSTNHWRPEDVVTGAEILSRIGNVSGLEPVAARDGSEVARRYRFSDGGGEVGVITSVSQPFCGACTRARLSADGKIYTCLFAMNGFDVRSLVRSGANEAELCEALAGHWRARSDRYSEERGQEREASLSRRRLPTLGPSDAARVEMSYIGG
jgi:cyclic pyranopterin phosphate synthase